MEQTIKSAHGTSPLPKLVGRKRPPPLSESFEQDLRSTKRECRAMDQPARKQDFSLAKYLLDNYQTLDQQSQNKILTNLDQLLKQDHSFFEQALIKQVKNHVTQASLLYETREQLKLQQLLMSLTPAASILLNIEVSLCNQTYHDEGNTLSYTLLPFIN